MAWGKLPELESRPRPKFPGVMMLLGPGIVWMALARPWERADATRLLTAITFAGLGGFGPLFYIYWIREKNAGMAGRFGRITGPISMLVYFGLTVGYFVVKYGPEAS